MPPSPLRFEPIEALSPNIAQSLPSTLQISGNLIYYKPLILRLLTGTINIKCNKTNKVIKQRNNYFTLSYTKNARVSKSIINTAIKPFNFTQYEQFIKKINNNNFKFYKEIFFEFCNYFFQKEGKNEIAAFIHLYRILERIAYCFPLLWAARAKNYEQTFDKLKSYFNDPKIGELGVFRRFVVDIIDQSFRQVPLTINITSSFPNWEKTHYDLLCRLIGQNSIVSQTANSQIIVHFEVLIDLVITIRNRYFHALTGHSNSFTSDEIVDANEFFNIINEDIANWLSFITFQIFEFEAK